MAAEAGVSAATVRCIWQAHGLIHIRTTQTYITNIRTNSGSLQWADEHRHFLSRTLATQNPCAPPTALLQPKKNQPKPVKI